MASFMRDFFDAFRGRDIVFALASDSHANRGMNKIANAFLTTDCDAWFNVDADIRFRKQDADHLIEHAENGIPLVYGVYPKKEDATSPCLCTFNTIDATDPKTGFVAVRRSGRGFMIVLRSVLEAMKEDNGGPALRYHNYGEGEELLVQWDFFPSGPVIGEFSALPEANDQDGFPVREWVSEDWFFCERARALGIPTMVDARIALGHVGLKEYRFNQTQVTRFDSEIDSWKYIHGWFDYADLYKEFAVKIPDGGTFVEVGAWMGKSVAAFAEFTKKLDKHVNIHVVDTFCGEPGNQAHAEMLDAHGGNVEHIFRANMAALGIQPHIHVEDSVKAAADFADGSIDVVFIDGDHREAGVRADIEAWMPKVKFGGILAGHDIDEPGVAAAVQHINFEVRNRSWMVRIPVIPFARNIAYADLAVK